MTTNYNKQATDFLEATNTTLEVVEAIPQKSPNWGIDNKDIHKHINYTVTLKNAKHSYTFDFWGSIHDYEIINAIKSMAGKYEGNFSSDDYRNIDILKKEGLAYRKFIMNTNANNNRIEAVAKYNPNAYDILASLSTCYSDSFEDFCFNFGYDEDSRKAYQTYKAVQEQELNLYKLFTHEELEQLAEIN